MGAHVPEARDKGLARAGYILEAAAKRQVSGRALNVDRGGFRSSIYTELNPGVVRVGPTVVYAQIHEFGGTYTHPNLFGKGIVAQITMPARAPMGKALDECRDKIRGAMSSAIMDIRGVG
jgi:phage gpG-like protein